MTKLKYIGRWLATYVLDLVRILIPARARVVVYGHPPTEGNAVQVLAALTRRYRGEIVWIVDSDTATTGVAAPQFHEVKVVRKASLSAVLAYASAEAIFVTHGLYGWPRLHERKPIVNLWHGDGFKVKRRRRLGRSDVPCDFVVGQARMTTEMKAADFGVARANTLVVGNARTELFFSANREQIVEALGLDAGRPIVVWMPTFRVARDIGGSQGWADGSEDAVSKVQDAGADLAASLDRVGAQLLVRPHPRDASWTRSSGLLTDRVLSEKSLHLYEVLGIADALVTDFSSVWTDFLILDKPIGFLLPDQEEYVAMRGLQPSDLLDWLPGPVLKSVEDIERFADEVKNAPARHLVERRHAASRLGLISTRTPADDLLDVLVERKQLRVGGLDGRY